MKIAILGASSQIAQDLILSFSKNKEYNLLLFGRNTELLKEWLNNVDLNEQYQVKPYTAFNDSQEYNVIVNFVGVGDPVKACEMGSDIFKITEQYDDMALDYIKSHKQTKYIFLSSGAVFSGDYQEPVNENTAAMIDINNLGPTDWYAIAKLYAEAKHRAMPNLSIVDVRVFNYFSHTQDMSARFSITDIVRAIKNKKVLKTSASNVVRDFITPPDFYRLIQAVIDCEFINVALDCYTKSPVSKFDLLDEMEREFGLKYDIDKGVNTVNATGDKFNYYSINDKAKNISYKPKATSLNGIIEQIQLLCKTI